MMDLCKFKYTLFHPLIGKRNRLNGADASGAGMHLFMHLSKSEMGELSMPLGALVHLLRTKRCF